MKGKLMLFIGRVHSSELGRTVSVGSRNARSALAAPSAGRASTSQCARRIARRHRQRVHCFSIRLIRLLIRNDINI